MMDVVTKEEANEEHIRVCPGLVDEFQIVFGHGVLVEKVAER